jgi:hypothetical protein
MVDAPSDLEDRAAHDSRTARDPSHLIVTLRLAVALGIGAAD